MPAGTKVLLQLRSAVNTKSAKPGDGVYLSSTFPVVVGNRVMIPAGVYVQGVVDRVVRGGRVKGKAQLDMHFTSIIFPNGSVVEIPGVVDSLPGAKNQTVKDRRGGNHPAEWRQGPERGPMPRKSPFRRAHGVGTIGGAAFRASDCRAAWPELGAGLAAVGIVTLFTRNADVDIPSGTQVEMVLQRPLVLEDENLAGVGQPGAAPRASPCRQPAETDYEHRPRILCPPGSLGCE